MPKKATRLTGVVSASVAALLVMSACGSDSDSDPTSDASKDASASESASVTLADPKPADTKKVKSIKITEAKGKKAPKISLAKKPLKVSQTTREVLDEGSGKAVPDDAYVEVDLAMFSGKDGKMIEGSETYTTSPIPLNLGTEGALPGLVKSIKGQKIGAHGISVMTPEDLFGEQGAPQYGVDGEDNLVLVYDVRGVMADQAEGKKVAAKAGLPKVTWHEDKAADIKIGKDVKKPKKLTTQKLIEGKGKTVKKGDQVFATYTGVHFNNGKVFDTSYKEGGQPYPFVVGQQGTIEGWQKAVEGAKVGDRLLVVIPSKYGYGKEGSPDGSIKPNEDLVFVMDILGAY